MPRENEYFDYYVVDLDNKQEQPSAFDNFASSHRLSMQEIVKLGEYLATCDKLGL